MINYQPEIKETEELLASATFDGTKTILQGHLNKLRKLDIESKTPINTAPLTTITHLPVPGPDPKVTAKVPVIPTAGNFINIADFAWDQGEYNTPIVSVFIDLENVGSAKDRVNVAFTKTSFDLTVIDLDGKSYRLLKDNLEKDIIPESSTFIVKKNKIVVKLHKVKGDYSYDNWTTLTSKKKKSEVEATKKDPMGGIMDMMKTMYEEGDDNMKKIIGESMLKSRNGEQPSPPELKGDF